MNGLPEDNHTNNIKDNKNIKKETIRGLKFTLFSLSAGIIEIASFTLLNELTGWPYWACYLTALVLSVLWNFTLNRRYTFRSVGKCIFRHVQNFSFLPGIYTCFNISGRLSCRYAYVE